ncbi:MAG: hypothetical protein B7Y30_12220, partial [Campylobacterales bacterium 16-40-21]
PGPIPNPEAKTLFAHNTASFRCGNVGRRLASDYNPPFFYDKSYFTSIKLIKNYTTEDAFILYNSIGTYSDYSFVTI